MAQDKLFFDVALERAFEMTVQTTLGSQAHGSDPTRRGWDEALSQYLAAEALAAADSHFGPYWKAATAHEDLIAELVAEHGRAWRSVPEAKARADASFEEYQEALSQREDALLVPLWAAESKLSNTPAPDMQAVAFKIEFIRRHGLMQDAAFKQSAFDLIREDIARLNKRTV